VKSMKTVILRDEQSLQDNIRGVVGIIGAEDTYQSDAGFYYKVLEITDHKVPNTNLAIVEKHANKNEFDTYVCYVPQDVTHGSREDNSFLFAEDENYNPAIYADNHEFGGVLHSNVEANGKNPGFAVEYRAADDVENPAVFVFETINPETQDSYVQLYRGYRVRQDEVSLM